MGWRAQHAYDEAQREDWQRFLAAQPSRRRFVIRVWQGLWVVVIAAIVFAALAASTGIGFS